MWITCPKAGPHSEKSSYSVDTNTCGRGGVLCWDHLLSRCQYYGDSGGILGFPGGLVIKKKIFLQCSRPGFDPWGGKIPWRREWLPTSVFLPGEFQGQKSLVGSSPWGRKESDITERLTHTHWRHLMCRPLSVGTRLRGSIAGSHGEE